MLYRIETPAHSQVNDSPTIKTTYAWGKDIARLAADEYIRRFSTRAWIAVPYNEDDGETNICDFFLDFGGMIIGSNEPYIIAVDGFRLGFHAHQAFAVSEALEKAIEKDRGGYVKVHGEWICICLPTILALNLLDEMKQHEGRAENLADEMFALWKKEQAAK